VVVPRGLGARQALSAALTASGGLPLSIPLQVCVAIGAVAVWMSVNAMRVKHQGHINTAPPSGSWPPPS
jgi:hypothetical protein